MIHSMPDNLLNDMHPLSFATGKAENEVFTLKDMLKQVDRALFADAMDKEINAHNKDNHWKIIKKSEVKSSIKKKANNILIERDSIL